MPPRPGNSRPSAITALGFWTAAFAPLFTFPAWPHAYSRTLSCLHYGYEIILGSAFLWFFFPRQIRPLRPIAVWPAVVLTFGLATAWAVGIRGVFQLPPAATISVELAYFIGLVGLAEELWFRGIWFAMFPTRPGVAIGVGTSLFALAHVFQGVAAMFMPLFVGLAFAVARYRGAPILALAAAHGFLDYESFDLLPGQALRFGAAGSILTFLGLYSAVMAVLLAWPADGRKSSAGIESPEPAASNPEAA